MDIDDTEEVMEEEPKLSPRDVLMTFTVPKIEKPVFLMIGQMENGSHKRIYPEGMEGDRVAENTTRHTALAEMYHIVLVLNIKSDDILYFLRELFYVEHAKVPVKYSTYDNKTGRIDLMHRPSVTKKMKVWKTLSIS